MLSLSIKLHQGKNMKKSFLQTAWEKSARVFRSLKNSALDDMKVMDANQGRAIYYTRGAKAAGKLLCATPFALAAMATDATSRKLGKPINQKAVNVYER
jgi:hypothetical protein